MKHQTTKFESPQKRGVILLIAVLMVSVTLAVGIGVYQRTYKELYFGSFWKQTQIAAAAADGGLECAMYWDLHPSATPSCFNNSSIPGLAASGGSGATYADGGGWNSYSITSTPNIDLIPRCSCDTGGLYECSAPTFSGTNVGAVCYDRYDMTCDSSCTGAGPWAAEVYNRTSVTGGSTVSPGTFSLDTNNGCVQVTITKPSPSGLSTRIEARGYNNTCATMNTNPRTVERGLYVEY